GDGDPDFQDEDSDDDSIPDDIEAGDDGENPVDTDGDGDPDYQDEDSDEDGHDDDIEAGEDGDNPLDTDGDGDPDFQDVDSDNDSIPDGTFEEEEDYEADCDNDGIPNVLDPDECIEELVIPQGFSPNGDGFGDTWVIPGLLDNYSQVSIQIFNRWGNLVYEQPDYQNDWNGRGNTQGAAALPGSTYFYILELDGQEKIQGYVYIAN
ncbi:MAG: gliding motility-associated C-terminal domain-containing protein, partial [Flavobacteriales bacterium]|nr:gliding motility-associated C-terminal domain-containing protein [Flavobacteriales bacterium]